jgi:molecular chaperone DnaJ
MVAPQREWLRRTTTPCSACPRTPPRTRSRRPTASSRARTTPTRTPTTRGRTRFKEIGEAYAVLGDEAKRREYDELRRLGAAGFGAGGFPAAVASAASGRGRPRRPPRPPVRRRGVGGGRRALARGPVRTGGRARRRTSGRRPPDLRGRARRGAHDAAGHRRRRLRHLRRVRRRARDDPRPAAMCGGRGQVTIDQGPFSFAQPCQAVRRSRPARSTRPARPAPAGPRRQAPQLTVRIPAGVRDGAVIRVAGRGGPGSGRRSVRRRARDRARRAQHPLFGRKGDDVTLEVPITFSEAALGTKLGSRPRGTASAPSRSRPAPRRPDLPHPRRGGPARRTGARAICWSRPRSRCRRISRDQRKLLEELAEHDDTTARDRMRCSTA